MRKGGREGTGWRGKKEMVSNWFKSIAAVKSNSDLRQKEQFAWFC